MLCGEFWIVEIGGVEVSCRIQGERKIKFETTAKLSEEEIAERFVPESISTVVLKTERGRKSFLSTNDDEIVRDTRRTSDPKAISAYFGIATTKSGTKRIRDEPGRKDRRTRGELKGRNDRTRPYPYMETTVQYGKLIRRLGKETRDESQETVRGRDENDRVESEESTIVDEIARVVSEETTIGDEIDRFESEETTIGDEIARVKSEESTIGDEIARFESEELTIGDEIARDESEESTGDENASYELEEPLSDEDKKTEEESEEFPPEEYINTRDDLEEHTAEEDLTTEEDKESSKATLVSSPKEETIFEGKAIREKPKGILGRKDFKEYTDEEGTEESEKRKKTEETQLTTSSNIRAANSTGTTTTTGTKTVIPTTELVSSTVLNSKIPEAEEKKKIEEVDEDKAEEEVQEVEQELQEELYKPEPIPYIVVLKTKTGTCTGTLIETNWVLTSARCVSGNYENKVDVYFNVRNFLDGINIKIKVSQIVINPEYISNSLENDIALIRLTQPVILSETIRTAALCRTAWQSSDAVRQCTASGYHYGISVQVNSLAATGRQKCLCLSEQQLICTKKNVGENKCITDIGGPLICSNKLVGIRFGNYLKSKCHEIKNKTQNFSKIEDGIKSAGKESKDLSNLSDPIQFNSTTETAMRKYRYKREIVVKKGKGGREMNENETTADNKPLDVSTVSTLQENGTLTRHNERIKYANLEKCTDKESLNVYTNINHYTDWIDQVLASEFAEYFIADETPHDISKQILDVLPRSEADRHYQRNCFEILLALLTIQAFLFI
ncbi:hypothetical protein O3M35_007164 [Rhynocoris fuscipes]|uniref:Peptidase S1 domain-containing protein n=1 Tax=Rhynocoris fuscipes TaxID=488301 RepID=A0AAW1DB08_9HEMI